MDSPAALPDDDSMSIRRFSVEVPTSVGEQLAAFAVRNGLHTSEVLSEALARFKPFQNFVRQRSSDDQKPEELWKILEELDHADTSSKD